MAERSQGRIWQPPFRFTVIGFSKLPPTITPPTMKITEKKWLRRAQYLHEIHRRRRQEDWYTRKGDRLNLFRELLEECKRLHYLTWQNPHQHQVWLSRQRGDTSPPHKLGIRNRLDEIRRCRLLLNKGYTDLTDWNVCIHPKDYSTPLQRVGQHIPF